MLQREVRFKINRGFIVVTYFEQSLSLVQVKIINLFIWFNPKENKIAIKICGKPQDVINLVSIYY